MANTVLTLQFVNLSKQNLILDQRGWETHPGCSTMTEEPGNELIATDGTQSLQYTQTRMGSILAGSVEMFCTWNNGQVRFGLKIKADIQVFTAGHSPYYYVMNDNNIWSKDIIWTHIDNIAQPHAWPVSIGFNIVADPFAPSTSSLTVKTTIQDLAS